MIWKLQKEQSLEHLILILLLIIDEIKIFQFTTILHQKIQAVTSRTYFE